MYEARKTIVQPKNPTRKIKRGKILWKSYIYFSLILLSALVIVPFFYLIVTSMKPLEEIATPTMQIFPRKFAFIENVKVVFNTKNYNYLRAFGNTMFVFLMKTAGVIITCSVAAYGFARFKCKLNSIVFMAFIAVLFLPGEILNIPFFEMMVTLNIRYDSAYLPMWLGAWFGIDITTIFLFKQFFESIPSELINAAKIDGCNELQAFLRVILPLSKPVIATNVILYFVGTYNDIYGPTLYVRANDYPGKLVSQTVGIFEGMFNAGSRDYLVPYNYVSVVTLVSILPTLVFFASAQNAFVESFVGSGLKG
ncbi:MAG: carbohydrate ABC transporter permease [Clostridia bacterium]|nr:carbohydrate ABC transporter permease [Clostridia bacterium]